MASPRRDAVDLSIRQFRHAWRVMCAGGPAHTAAVDDGIEYIFSGLPISFFNVALLTGRGVPGGALQDHAENACAWVADKPVPWLFVVTHEALTEGVDATAILDGCGLAPVMPLTGMRADQVGPVTQGPDGLRLTVPDSEAGCSQVLDMNSLAYGMDLDAGKAVLGQPSFWTGHVPAVGMVGSMPASAAAVLMVDGYRYVAMVATDPAQQRRGYAEATMRHALDVAATRHGALPTFLHATDAGRPIYQRMGYEAVATHTLFMEKRFLEGH
jgi:GNAT superfamily N-acetyltransferase